MGRYPLIGAHISIAGGYYKSVERAESIGCTTMQIFTKSNRTWHAKKITSEEANKFKDVLKKSAISKVMVHASYLINLGSSEETRNKSLSALKEELERADLLGIKYLVIHPGSHIGSGEETGIEKISNGIDEVFRQTKSKTHILLETAAGQGSNLGYTFEQIKAIYKHSKSKAKLGVCLDTCHVFSAGYDISSEEKYKNVIKKFDRIIGLKLLKAIHLNSSKTQLGSRKDRHEKIGKGTIPLKIFKLIMNDPRFKKIPKILETPVIKDALSEYKAEIKLLKSLI